MTSTSRRPSVDPHVTAPRRGEPVSWLTAPWTEGLLAACAGLLLVSSVVAALRVNRTSFPGLNSLERWFWVDREEGLPAWFSTILLFLRAQAFWRLAATSLAGERRRWYHHEVVLAVLTIGYLRALPRHSLVAFLVAGAVYVGGAAASR